MKVNLVLAAAGLALTAAGCGSNLQQSTSQHARSRTSALQCERVRGASESATQALLAGTVYRAEPVHYQRTYAGGPQADHLIGATLYVPAEAGQTEASLERAMSCHIASGHAGAHASDPLGAEGVQHVRVRSEGSSFAVAIVGRDARSGEAIWQRASALAGKVGVRQIASSQPTSAF